MSDDFYDNPRDKDRQELADDREARLYVEIERQRHIRRPGTNDYVLKRAAVAALMERGEW